MKGESETLKKGVRLHAEVEGAIRNDALPSLWALATLVTGRPDGIAITKRWYGSRVGVNWGGDIGRRTHRYFFMSPAECEWRIRGLLWSQWRGHAP